jgi:hypothetical protein
MVTEKQLIANRQNSYLGGPKTEAGKATVRLNAVTHGLLTKEVLTRGENSAVLNRLQNNLMFELAPEGELETMLVERIASGIWRLRRVLRVETGLDRGEKEQPFTDYSIVRRGLDLNRYETSIERQIYKAKHELERMQGIRRGENMPAPLAIDVDVSQQN